MPSVFKSMKILVVSHTYIIEINRQKLLALSQLEPNLEVIIVVPRLWQTGGVQNKIIKSEFSQNGTLKIVPISNFSQNHQGLLTFGADLIKLLYEFRPDIIQVEQGSRSLAYTQLIILNKILGLKAKNIFFTWWNLPYKLKFPISLLEAYNLHNTDGIIAGNQDGVDILRQHGYKRLIKVMPQLGVNEKLFKPQYQPELQAKLGIKANDFVVGYVGRFVEEKGLLTLAKALDNIKKYPWKWLLIGRGSLQATVEEWARKNNLENRLIWVESVAHEEVYKYINLMNTLVLPSQTSYQFKTLTAIGWKEQFGHVLIEAMACQVPVIGSNSGEIPHVIGDAGLIFAEGNAEELQNCLIQLMENSELAENLAIRGRDRVLNQYTNTALARQLLYFYQQELMNK